MIRPLLRYPGGKTNAIKHILPYLQEEKEIFSPFLGGGSIELNCAENSMVYAYDSFPQLVNFWNNALNNREELYFLVKEHWQFFHSDNLIDDDKRTQYYNLREFCLKEKDTTKSAAAFFVVNRISFSGLTLLGGFSKAAIKMEFGPGILERLKNFKCDNLKVKCCSFEESILKHKDIRGYLDPPYYLKKGWLYGEDGSCHRNFNHKLLSDILHSRDNWILSYNNCDEVKEMYKGYHMIEPEWYYSSTKSGESKELLIFSSMVTAEIFLEETLTRCHF